MAGTNDAAQNTRFRYTVIVGGQELSQANSQGLEAINVEDHVDMIGVAEITIGATPDGSDVGWGGLEVGSDIQVKGGGSGEFLFTGVITGLRHSFMRGKSDGTVTILAMDPTCKLAASRMVSAWPNPPKGPTDPSQTILDSDVMNEVISNGGCQVGQVDATEDQHKYVFQRNESNLRFLRRLAARNGMYVRCNPSDGSVEVVKLQFSGSPIEIPKADIIQLDYTFSPRALPPKLTTYGWDYTAKEKVEGTASSGDIELIGGGTNAVESPAIWQGDGAYVSDVWVGSQQMAKNLAVSELNRMARNFLRGKAIVAQNAAIRAGTLVKFEGHRTGFNAEGYVLSTRHRWYMNGDATTEIMFCANTFADGGSGGGSGDALAGTPVTSPNSAPGLGGVGGGGGGGPLGGLGGGGVGGGGGPLGDLGNSLGGGFDNAMDQLQSGDVHGAIDSAKNAAQGAVDGVAGAGKDLVSQGADALRDGTDMLTDQATGALGDLAGDIGDGVDLGPLDGALDDALQQGVGQATGELNDLNQQVNEAANRAEQAAHGAIDRAAGAVNQGIEQAATGAHQAVDQVEDSLGVDLGDWDNQVGDAAGRIPANGPLGGGGGGGGGGGRGGGGGGGRGGGQQQQQQQQGGGGGGRGGGGRGQGGGGGGGGGGGRGGGGRRQRIKSAAQDRGMSESEVKQAAEDRKGS